MAETHQAEPGFLVLRAIDGFGDVLRVADLLEHLQHGFVRAAVRRTPQRGDAGGDACVRIRAGRTDQAHRRGRRVLLVVGVQDEQQIERLGGDRIQLQRLARHFEHHVQEARHVFEIVARIADRPADRIAIRGRGDRRHLRDQADRGEPALLRIVDVERVVIERRQRSDRRAQDRHRMRVVMEAVQKVLERLVHHRVMRDFVLERGELVRRRQLAVDQEVGDFEKARLLGQLLDRITAIEQRQHEKHHDGAVHRHQRQVRLGLMSPSSGSAAVGQIK